MRVAECGDGSRSLTAVVRVSEIATVVALAVFWSVGCRTPSPAATPARPPGTWIAPTRTASSAGMAPAPTAPSEREPDQVVTDAPAKPLQVRPEFPTHTTVQEPYLGKQLDLTAPLSPYFTSTPGLRREHGLARQLVQGVGQALRSRRWHLEIRTGCPVEYGGNVIVEGRALVRDHTGKVFAYSEQTGTGDSAGIWKLYYDGAARLRIAVFAWSNYMGQSAEGIIAFDEAGRLERCSSPPQAEPPWACETEQGLDPAVTAALQPKIRPPASERKRGTGPIDWAVSLDPVAAWSTCGTLYRPHQ
jgi:hypothetical protein